ncbi:MAG TPA: hypothetical protein VFF27_16965 [Bacteroidia bacterium]|jgi:hypothetical protein|nr:hypothetical protein [Bacteroidia bacterium]
MAAIIDRKQTKKIGLLRFTFVAIAFLVVGLAKYKLNDYALVTCLFFSVLLIPSITEFTLFKEKILVRRYFSYASLERLMSWNFQVLN